MIIFSNSNETVPYKIFRHKYYESLKNSQKNIEAISISSYSSKLNLVNARYVNLKFVDNEDFIFFSNYNSPKSIEFNSHKQVTVLIFWNTINLQIRMQGNIKKTSKHFNKSYFKKRDIYKNALAISSKQSEKIKSYENVSENYQRSLQSENLKECPDYWGGFSFTPYYFEFWTGHESRINKRDIYELIDNNWIHSMLQP